jgi:hypothetical protein
VASWYSKKQKQAIEFRKRKNQRKPGRQKTNTSQFIHPADSLLNNFAAAGEHRPFYFIEGETMNKIFHKITSIMILFALALGSHTKNASASASVTSILRKGNDAQHLLPPATQPGVGDAVVYVKPQVNGTALTNVQIEAQFGLVIYAYNQMRSYPGRSGTELIYFDVNKINGPTGLSAPGAVCSSAQKAETSYFSDTVTVGFTFCTILDAIKAGTPINDIVPTEGIFLHSSSGTRLYKTGSAGAAYYINPADPFIRNYTVKRYLEKIAELGIDGGFSDNLQPGWSKVTSAGTPVEYASWTNYNDAMAGFACEIYSALKAAGKEVWGNMTSMHSPSVWAQYFACLDGAMAETWIMDWGGFPSAATMAADLSAAKAWLDSGKKVLLIAQDVDPDSASNQFVYASSLLVGNTISQTFYRYAHYNGSYSEYMPLQTASLGNPRGPLYQVSTNVWERSFDTGCVHVDLSAVTSLITGSPCAAAPIQTGAITNTPQAQTAIPNSTFTASPTFTTTPAITATTIITPLPTFTATPGVVSPTAELPSPTITSVVPSATPVVAPSSETIYDNKNSSFAYSSGWTTVSTSKAYKGSYRETTKNDATATLTFTGQSFSIIYKGGVAFSKLDVYVDEVLVGTLNQNLTTTTYQSRWDYPSQLTYSNHILKLVFKVASATVNRGSLDAVIIR